jgi:hypothetical protein
MWLYTTVTPELRAMVSSPTTTARDIWNSLENIFCNNTLTHAINLTNGLHVERQGDLSIASYCARLKSISDQLRDIGIRCPLMPCYWCCSAISTLATR